MVDAENNDKRDSKYSDDTVTPTTKKENNTVVQNNPQEKKGSLFCGKNSPIITKPSSSDFTNSSDSIVASSSNTNFGSNKKENTVIVPNTPKVNATSLFCGRDTTTPTSIRRKKSTTSTSVYYGKNSIQISSSENKTSSSSIPFHLMTDDQLMDRQKNKSPGQIRLIADVLQTHDQFCQKEQYTIPSNNSISSNNSRNRNSNKGRNDDILPTMSNETMLPSYDNWKQIQERKKQLKSQWEEEDQRIQQKLEQMKLDQEELELEQQRRQQLSPQQKPSPLALSQSEDSFFHNNKFSSVDDLSLAPLDSFLTTEVIAAEEEGDNTTTSNQTTDQQQSKRKKGEKIVRNNSNSSIWGKLRRRKEQQQQQKQQLLQEQLFEGKITKFHHHNNDTTTTNNTRARKNVDMYLTQEIKKQKEAVLEKHIKEERERIRIETRKMSYLQKQRDIEGVNKRDIEGRKPQNNNKSNFIPYHNINNNNNPIANCSLSSISMASSSVITPLTTIKENNNNDKIKLKDNNDNNNANANTNTTKTNNTTIQPLKLEKSSSCFTLNTTPSSRPCAVCEVGKRTHIAMPCMHYSFCEECVEALQDRRVTQCPICRANNVVFTKIFK